MESPEEVGINSLSGQRYLPFEQPGPKWREAVWFLRCLVKFLKAMSLPSHEYNNYFVKLNLFRHKKDVYLR